MTMNYAVLLDGDDTLWKLQETYNEIKDRYSALLQDIGINDSQIVSKLDDLDSHRVALRGFIPQRFLESMLILYGQLLERHGVAWDANTERDIHNMFSLLMRPPELYNDTIASLESLSTRTRLFLVTSGDETAQKEKVQHLGIRRFFKDVFVVSAKNEGALQRILSVIGSEPKQTWMVGNSPRSDILPAMHIGMHAILLLRGGWEYDMVDLAQYQNSGLHTVPTLRDAVEIILPEVSKDC
jgi:putative hydrolase of the HAD superfamily